MCLDIAGSPGGKHTLQVVLNPQRRALAGKSERKRRLARQQAEAGSSQP
jgi:hypothetical protein